MHRPSTRRSRQTPNVLWGLASSLVSKSALTRLADVKTLSSAGEGDVERPGAGWRFLLDRVRVEDNGRVVLQALGVQGVDDDESARRFVKLSAEGCGGGLGRGETGDDAHRALYRRECLGDRCFEVVTVLGREAGGAHGVGQPRLGCRLLRVPARISEDLGRVAVVGAQLVNVA